MFASGMFSSGPLTSAPSISVSCISGSACSGSSRSSKPYQSNGAASLKASKLESNEATGHRIATAAAAATAAVFAGRTAVRRLRRQLRRSGNVARKGIDDVGKLDFDSTEALREEAKPDRTEGLNASTSTKLRGLNYTSKDVIPEEVLSGKYGDLLAEVIDLMTTTVHLLSIGTLLLEEAKDKGAVGLYGSVIDRQYVRARTDDPGVDTIMPEAAVTVYLMKWLKEKFPDDPVLSNVDPELMPNDKPFAGSVGLFLDHYGIVEGCDEDMVIELTRHATTYPKDAETSPKRYWVVNPIETVTEFRGAKQFCSSIALMEDNEPIISAMIAPMLSFDHASRSTPHPAGCPIFWAAKGQGAWTQLVRLERQVGVYQAKYGLKGKSMKLEASEKIKRGNDGLFDMVDTYQLRIAQGARMRQDIAVDAQCIAKILGSEYPKYDMCDNALKYCYLARGDEDLIWFLRDGLYTKGNSAEPVLAHAAGVLIARESGAAVADFNGNEPDFSTGSLMINNRGMAATDPMKVPMVGLVRAIEQSTAASQKAHETRSVKRAETAQMLAKVFANIGKKAQTEEEKRGAAIVAKRGEEYLRKEDEMNKLAQDSLNRESPLFGEGPVSDNPFKDDGTAPYSPISV